MSVHSGPLREPLHDDRDEIPETGGIVLMVLLLLALSVLAAVAI